MEERMLITYMDLMPRIREGLFGKLAAVGPH